jgi:Tol biopolymer transport system component
MRGALVLLVFVLLSVAAPASATLPGHNGVVAFSAYSLDEESTDIVIDRQVIAVAPLPGALRIFGVGSSPAFSPGGGRIAYAAADDSRAPGIWLARSDCRRPNGSPPPPCSKLKRLTHGETDASPAWSPNGQRVAFVRGDSRIYTVRARGGGRRLLVGGHDPDWSPTGALAFTAGTFGSGDAPIRVREPGGHIRRLGVVGRGASWAPTGDRLAFSAYSDTPSRTSGLYVINADGTGLRKIWHSDEGEVPAAATWSPDGRSIAFIKDFQDGYTGWVYAVRPNGQGLRVLIRVPNDLNADDLAWQRLR